MLLSTADFTYYRWTQNQAIQLIQAVFTNLLGNTNQRICLILVFRKKILSLERKSLSLREFYELIKWKFAVFAQNLLSYLVVKFA